MIRNKESEIKILKGFVKHSALIMLLMLTLISSLLTDSFFTSLNLFNLLRQSVPILLVSIGMLLVIVTGGIDLSVGSIAGASSMVFANALVNWNLFSAFGLLGALFLSLVFGFALGSITGLLITYGRMAPFIASLAMMTIARGIAFLVTSGQPIRLVPDNTSTEIMNSFGSNKVFGTPIPWPVVLGLVFVIVFYYIMKYFPFGRILVAIGSNEESVRLAGINIKVYKIMAYAVSGALCAMAGIVAVSRTSIGTPVTGTNYEMDAIASCVIGGASLAGGKGGVINTLIGVLVLGLIGNTMNLLSVPAYPQQIIKGLIIIGAVILQQSSLNIKKLN